MAYIEEDDAEILLSHWVAMRSQRQLLLQQAALCMATAEQGMWLR